MANLKDLANRLNKYADKLEAAPSKVAADLSLLLIGELVERTPVDTSKAISNWLLSLDEPVLVELDAYYEGMFGSTAAASRQEVISFAQSKLGSKQPGQSVFISNSAPYIVSLDEGSSQQAPAGFSKISVFIARKQIPALFKKAMK